MEINVGLRVVRGPDWKWSNQGLYSYQNQLIN